MRRVDLVPGADLDGFRRAVRALVADDVPPEAVIWTGGEGGLFGQQLQLGDAASCCPPPRGEGRVAGGTRELDRGIGGAPPTPGPSPQRRGERAGAAHDRSTDPPAISLPRKLAELIADVVPHRDPERYALLYGLVWRSLHGEHDVAEFASDPAVHRLEMMGKAVKRDIHKMHAFLRFRRAEGERERYVAWFEPEHFILEAAAPFFVDRFRSMVWSILTPIGSIHWDGETLRFGPPADRREAPAGDRFEEGWRGYYESAFNPARTNPKLMRQHMAKKYWHNMPEAAAIPALVRSASSRVNAMLEQEPTMPTKRVPEGALAQMLDQAPASLAELNAVIRAAGPLVPGATQAVVGEGPANAEIVFVGEQPGDEEDIQGRPFVGPAGRLLDRAMGEAGIDRSKVYLTNAVKHFKFEQRGKRRIHQKPTAGEVSHYRWWLMRELELIEPKLVVALGGTAVLALTGKQVPITRARGPAELLEHFRGYITVHPSYLLRIPEHDAKIMAYEQFVGDLQAVREIAREARRPHHAAAE